VPVKFRIMSAPICAGWSRAALYDEIREAVAVQAAAYGAFLEYDLFQN